MARKDDVGRFHELSATYDSSWFQRYIEPLHDAVLEQALRALQGRNPNAIVDVGCGTGRLLRKASQHWPSAELIGIDPAAGMIEVARNLSPNARFYQAPAENLPLADASADLVLSSISMHHWSDAGLGMREIHRVLRDRGIFCLADIAIPSWLAKLFRSKAKSGAERAELLRGNGFSIRHQQSVWSGFALISTTESFPAE